MYLDNLFDRCIDSGFVLISSKLLDKELYSCTVFVQVLLVAEQIKLTILVLH